MSMNLKEMSEKYDEAQYSGDPAKAEAAREAAFIIEKIAELDGRMALVENAISVATAAKKTETKNGEPKIAS